MARSVSGWHSAQPGSAAVQPGRRDRLQRARHRRRRAFGADHAGAAAAKSSCSIDSGCEALNEFPELQGRRLLYESIRRMLSAQVVRRDRRHPSGRSERRCRPAPTQARTAGPLVKFSEAMRAEFGRAEALPVAATCTAIRRSLRRPGRRSRWCANCSRSTWRHPGQMPPDFAASADIATGRGRLHRRHDRPLRRARTRTPDRPQAAGLTMRRARSGIAGGAGRHQRGAARRQAAAGPAGAARRLGVTLVQAGFLLSLVQLAGMTLGLRGRPGGRRLGLKRTMVGGLVHPFGGEPAGRLGPRAAHADAAARRRGVGFSAGGDAGAQPDSPAGGSGAHEHDPRAVGRVHAVRHGACAVVRPAAHRVAGLAGLVVAAGGRFVLRWRYGSGWRCLRTTPIAHVAQRRRAGMVRAAAADTLSSPRAVARGPELRRLLQPVAGGDRIPAHRCTRRPDSAPPWLVPATALAAAVNMVGNIASGRLLQRGLRPERLLYLGFVGDGAWAALSPSRRSGTRSTPQLAAALRYAGRADVLAGRRPDPGYAVFAGGAAGAGRTHDLDDGGLDAAVVRIGPVCRPAAGRVGRGTRRRLAMELGSDGQLVLSRDWRLAGCIGGLLRRSRAQ